MNRYPVGNTAAVYYNPQQPASAVLVRGAAGWATWLLLALGLGTLGAAVVVALPRRRPFAKGNVAVRVPPPTVVPAGRALAMITIDVARALGMADEIGSLEVGKQADIAILDARQPHLFPFAAALAPLRLAYAATGSAVRTVIVAGRILMEDRRVLTVDEGAILDAAEREAQALLDRGDARDALDLPANFWTGLRYEES